ncbi:AAA family ATPase [Halochromatium roseum]|uniref:AAA family ATPase n=1 Tax=Halochromatium roseum TaxID=391920 RepID=UPI001A91AA54
MLIQLYLINRWLEKGGVALIDEPDLYLHPSLVSSFLARLEKMVADRDGQLLITSHVPEVWSRYEALGRRILLEVSLERQNGWHTSWRRHPAPYSVRLRPDHQGWHRARVERTNPAPVFAGGSGPACPSPKKRGFQAQSRPRRFASLLSAEKYSPILSEL